MDSFDITSSLKLQTYMNNQDDNEQSMGLLNSLKLKNVRSDEDKVDMLNNVRLYKQLVEQNMQNPSPDIDDRIRDLSTNTLCDYGIPITSIKSSDIVTDSDILDAINQSYCISKNDLFVSIDYDDFSDSSIFAKCKMVGHDYGCAYGIAPGAKMVVTKDGTIITTKNAIYCK